MEFYLQNGKFVYKNKIDGNFTYNTGVSLTDRIRPCGKREFWTTNGILEINVSFLKFPDYEVII